MKRSHPDWKSEPITTETYDALLSALEKAYPGKWRRSVDVCPVAVNKTIDNEADALETIRRIEEKCGPTKIYLEDGSFMGYKQASV